MGQFRAPQQPSREQMQRTWINTRSNEGMRSRCGMQKVIEAEQMPGGKGGAEMTAELVKMKGKFSKTQKITKTMTRNSFSVLPGIPTHQPLQLSFLMFYHFMYETKLPNKAVAGLKPSTDLRNGVFVFFNNERRIYVNKAMKQTLFQKHQPLGNLLSSFVPMTPRHF